jgi:adenylate cyclase
LVTLLGHWLDRASRVVFAHGGTLDKFIGDAVMAVFGAPFPLPDAAVRAVHCALGLRQVIAEVSHATGVNLSITVGINSGKMVAGSVGSPKRLEFTVLGDAVNVASRLQGTAGRGEILVGETTVHQLAGTIQVEPMGPLHVKNRKNPIAAYRVVG